MKSYYVTLYYGYWDLDLGVARIVAEDEDKAVAIAKTYCKDMIGDHIEAKDLTLVKVEERE